MGLLASSRTDGALDLLDGGCTIGYWMLDVGLL